MKETVETIHMLRRRQAAIASFGSLVLRQSNLLAAFNEAAQVCAESLGVRFCKVCRYRAKENDPLIIAGWGWKDGVVGHVVTSADKSSPKGYSFIIGELSMCKDLSKEKNFKLSAFYAEYYIVSTIDVIIKGDNQPYGVLEVDSDVPGDYDRHDVAFLTAFANVLGASHSGG
jgi:putative methionine-R-sulfoxide reductase with GAF domain